MSKPQIKRSTLLMPADYHTKWKVTAAGLGISMNEFAMRAMFHYFEDISMKQQMQIYEESKAQLDMFKRAQ